MNLVKIYSIVNSFTTYNKKIFVNDVPISTFPKKDVRVITSGWSITSPQAIELINHVINNDEDGVRSVLLRYKDQFYVNAHVYIYYQGAKNNLSDYTTVSKSGKRVLALPQDRMAYIKPETFIKRYKLAGNPKKLPYLNYDTNDTGNKNCVYEYVKKTYKKISTKQIDKFFNKDTVVVEDVIDFCHHYKIKLQLWNLEKVILTNEFQDDKDYKNKNYKDFVAIICNNHLYPNIKNDKDSRSSNAPVLNEEITAEQDIKNSILYIKNDKITISNEGKIEINQDKIIENAFFKNITPNFSYRSEGDYHMKSLMYVDNLITDIETKYEEYDINKAYYTMATEIIKPQDECPVFTASSMWIKYDINNEVKEYNYYLISKKILKRCKKMGFMSNLVMGHIVNFLISKEIMTKEDIKYVKNATYTIQWTTIQRRINEIKEKCEIKDEFIFYNGILGKVKQSNSMKYTGLIEDDIKLLNYNKETDSFDDKWLEESMAVNLDDDDEENNDYSATKTTHSFKYVNTVNIYNYVISRCNLFLLEVLFNTLENNKDLKIIKIKVDSLVFDRPVKLAEEYAKYFKVVPDDKIHKKYYNYEQIYINGKELGDKIIDELECFKKNVSFSGPPGTGKTTKVKNSLSYDIATTTTNLCLLNLMQDDDNKIYGTTYSLFNLFDPSSMHDKFRKLYNRQIWIDEFSMIPAYVWGFVYVLSHTYNCKFILSGDMNQIGPIGENKININDTFYKHLFSKMEILNIDYRNDKDIIELRDFVLDNNCYGIKNKFRSLYDEKMGFLKYRRHIAFTHETKDIVNYLIVRNNNLKYKWTNTPYTDKNGLTKYKSTLDVDNGVILSCMRSSKSNGLFKNDIWEVIEKLADGYRLTNLLRNKILDVKMANMVAYTLGYCTTAHSSQGLTITDDMCIHDIELMTNVDTAILYTAITRAKNYNKLHFYKGGFKYADYGFNYHSYNIEVSTPREKLLNDEQDEFNKYETMKCIN